MQEQKPLNLFIDTNVFLSLYHFSKDDLEQLKQLGDLIADNHVRLWLPSQVRDEFWRNREGKIQEALKTLKELKLSVSFPILCRDYPEYKQLLGYQKQFASLHSQLLENIQKHVREETLRADEVIKLLFLRAASIKVTKNIFEAARMRFEAGNPPGKNHSLGDAINWTLLLEEVPNGETLYFITDDKDYYSPIDEGRFNSFLSYEWRKEKNAPLESYRNLTSFFNEHLPTIELRTELEKEKLIERLSESGTFTSTHTIIASLRRYKDFTADQRTKLLTIAVTNTQVGWIIRDDDLQRLYTELINGHESEIDAELLAVYQELTEEPEEVGAEEFDPVEEEEDWPW